MSKTKLKILDAIPTSQFIGFVIAIIIFILTNIGLDWEKDGLQSPTIKVIGYIIAAALIVSLGIKKPGFAGFMSKLIETLRDGKISPEEKLQLIEAFKDEFLGQWADLSSMIYSEIMEKKDGDPTPPPDLLD